MLKINKLKSRDSQKIELKIIYFITVIWPVNHEKNI